ncbi:MAG: DALR anticodon-binding domain-containing protein, partial [Acidobacteriota bacterium]
LRELQATLDARLVRLLGRRGFVFDEIEAARAVDSARLVDLLGRLQALRDARGTPALRALAAVARRIAATLDGAESHGGRAAETGLSEEALTAPADGLHPAEAGLADDLARLEPEVADAAEARDFARCLQSLGELPPSIDRLLSEVLVLDDDAARRAARLDLLERVRRLFRHVARFEDLRPVDAVQSAT